MVEPNAPVDAATCPLCGEANLCALGKPGASPACTDCWCTRLKIDTTVLQRVPPHLTNQACICRACATAAPIVRDDD